MALSLQDLQDIVAICEHGSFRKAAMHLGISQPTLSGRVAHMESSLGASLFERSRGRSRPTQLTETIVRQSSGLLEQLGGLVRQVEGLARGARGQVRLGLGPIPAYCMTERLFECITQQIPGATLVIHTDGAQRLLSALSDGDIDLAFCAGDAEFMRPEFDREVVLKQRGAVIVSPRHPLAGAGGVSFRDALGHPVALPVLDPRYRHMVRNAIGKDPAAIEGAVFCSDYWMLRPLVASGRYLTICTPFCFARAIADGELVEVPISDDFIHEICLYTNRWSLPLPAVAEVTSIIREQCANEQRRIDTAAA